MRKAIPIQSPADLPEGAVLPPWLTVVDEDGGMVHVVPTQGEAHFLVGCWCRPRIEREREDDAALGLGPVTPLVIHELVN